MSETTAEYWLRKQAEVALLARHAGVEPRPVTHRGELWREKQRLRAALLGRAFTSDPGLTESNFFGEHGPFRYSYQRFNMRFRTRGFLEEVYGFPRRGPAFGLWGGSGTGTITAALRALDDSLDRPRRFLHPHDCYFETRGVLPLLDKLLPNDDDDSFLDGDVFLLDSVTVDDHFPLLTRNSLGPLSLVLYDTTAHPPDSPLIDRVVRRCADERVPLLLLRSHLKLDCLATEYARLGSAVFCLPPKPPKELVARMVALRNGLFSELVRAGAMALPTALWPLRNDPEFRALNATWNRRRVAAQVQVGEALKDVLPRVKVTVPHHRCFVFFDPLPRSSRRVHNDLERLVERLAAAGLEPRSVPSFGFEVVALCVVPLEAGPMLRIAVPDLPGEELERLIEVLRSYWQE